ncbi:MAG: hypothetical protein L0312_33850, partial [Acidobacteria bacterium]|nr:hypothetical protein [Acidobacteriota bacterium]
FTTEFQAHDTLQAMRAMAHPVQTNPTPAIFRKMDLPDAQIDANQTLLDHCLSSFRIHLPG